MALSNAEDRELQGAAPSRVPRHGLDEEVIGVMPINPMTDIVVSFTRKRRDRGIVDPWRLEIRAWARHAGGVRTPLSGLGVFFELKWVPALLAIMKQTVAELEPGPDGLPVRRNQSDPGHAGRR